MALASKLTQEAMTKGIMGVSRCFSSASAGVVRIVKSANVSGLKENVFPTGNVSVPLMNRGPIDIQRAERVAMDVRVADLFRQYKISSSKANMLSVLDNLALMNINSTILAKFPGFIELIEDLSKKTRASELTPSEFIRVIEVLYKLRLKPRGENLGINADELSVGFSNQLVSFLDSVSKEDLTRTFLRIQKYMQLDLDSYFYWALNREINRWASDKSTSDEEYVRSVLGPLQVLTQESLAEKVKTVFSNPLVERRIIDLIMSNKLNNLQLLELVTNFKSVGFTQMIQVAITSIVSGYKDRLVSSIADLAVLISALPSEGALRDKSLQMQLCELVLAHLEKGTSDPKDLKHLIESVSGVITDPSTETEGEILHLCAPLVLDNALVVNKLDPDRVADLLYIFATGALTRESSRDQFASVCSQIESVVVGRMPQLGCVQLAKLSLAFGSGILSYISSFKALGATVRSKSSQFPPHNFVEAIYGLAYRGILAKSTLVEGNVHSILRSVPVVSLPKLGWSVAVADFTVPGLWEPLLQRVDKEILLRPSVLESLTEADESLMYEFLVFAKTSNLGHISKNAERRIAQFEKSWAPPVKRSEENYEAMLKRINVKADFRVKQPYFMLDLPVFIDEFKLVIDATREPATASGMTLGSIKIRHSLWAKMGFNVIALSDTQFSSCENKLTEKSKFLGSIISQFVSELEATKSPIDEKASPAEWTSRVGKEPRKEEGEWKSRSAKISAKPRNQSADWSSRVD